MPAGMEDLIITSKLLIGGGTILYFSAAADLFLGFPACKTNTQSLYSVDLHSSTTCLWQQ